MAANAFQGELYCEICRESFPFRSRLTRHLKSARHQVMEAVFSKHRQFAQPSSRQQLPSESELMHHQETYTTGTVLSEDELDESSSEEWQEEISDKLIEEIMTLNSSDFSPFPNKQFALLYLLLHGPHPIGETSASFLWFIIKECGLDIPSITTLKLWALPGLKLPCRQLSPDGIPFYYVSLATTIQQFIGNPKASSMIARYPVHTDGPYSEMFHAQRWRNNTCYHTPMVTLMDGTHVFVRDCVYFSYAQFIAVKGIILRIFSMNLPHQIYCEVEVLLSNEQFSNTSEYQSGCCIPDDCFVIYHTMIIPISCIECLSPPPKCIIRWKEHGFQRYSLQETTDYFATHALKLKAGGRPVVVLPLVLFSDDTSGNKSKKWHEFNSWYLVFAGLPCHERSKLLNLVFICTSDKVSTLDMSKPIVEELKVLESEGVEAYDAYQKANVLVIAPLMSVIADNPRASELSSHLGSTANKYCRFCMADRNDSPTMISEPRTLQNSITQIADIVSASTKERKAVLRSLYGLRETPNAMLGLNIDIYQSLPIEPLHTILLGSCKYILGQLMPLFSSQQKEEILARVRAFNTSGFQTKMYGNVCRYYGSFVGRDFKAWSQMAPFILDPYINEEHRKVLLSYSKVFQIMYCDSFSPSMFDNYQAVCQSFVDTVNEHMPELIHKLKIHLVLHIPQCFKEYGPTSAFSAERFESFNSKVREQNLFSNRRAPSRDIAKHFAILQHIRTITDGGYYGNNEKCGEALTELFASSNVQAYFIGTSKRQLFSEKEIYKPGSPRLLSHKSKSLMLKSIAISGVGYDQYSLEQLQHLLPPFEVILSHASQGGHTMVLSYQGVISKCLQLVHNSEFVELCVPFQNFKFGVLLNTCKSKDDVFCVIQGFLPTTTQSGAPLLSQHDCFLFELTKTIFTTESNNLLKAVSFVHMCSDSCKFENTMTTVVSEQEEVNTTGLIFKHDYCNYLYCYNQFCMCG